MLAQGQSSSAKRGGLAADVRSGLIVLKKKKKEKSISGLHAGDSDSADLGWKPLLGISFQSSPK